MTDSPASVAPSDQRPSDISKVRRCLKCRATFPSEWSGERICSRCKHSNAWRTGVSIASSPVRRRR